MSLNLVWLFYGNNILYGNTYFVPGFMIPQIALKLDCKPSSLGFLFFVVGLGSLLGAYLIRQISTKLTISQFLLIWNVILTISMLTIWKTQSLLLLTIEFFIFSLSEGVLEVLIIAGAIEHKSKDDNQPIYILTTCFSLGAFTFPVIFGALNSGSLIVLSVISLALALGFFLLVLAKKGKVPDEPLTTRVSRITAQSIMDLAQEFSRSSRPHSGITRASNFRGSINTNLENLVEMPANVKVWFMIFSVIYCLIVNCCFYLLPTFFSDMGQLSEQEISQIMFAILLLCFFSRIVGSYFISKAEYMIKVSCYGVLAGSLVMLVLMPCGFIRLGSYAGPIIFAVSIGNIYPLIFVLPLETGYKVSAELIAEIVIFMSLSFTLLPFAVTFFMYAITDYFLPLTIGLGALCMIEVAKRYHKLAQESKSNCSNQLTLQLVGQIH